MAGFNIDIELELLGPPQESEIAKFKEEIASEGANYIAVPPLRGDWPFYTLGRGKLKPPGGEDSDGCGEDDCGS